MTFSSRLYRKTLLLYPADLRREFGEDMTATFAEDLSNSVGIARKLRVWWCCLMDVLRIAIPAQKENPLVMVPLVAFFSVTTWDAVALAGAFWHGEPPFGQMPVSEIIGSWSIPSLTVAFVGFVVARFGRPTFTSLPLR